MLITIMLQVYLIRNYLSVNINTTIIGDKSYSGLKEFNVNTPVRRN